MAITDKENTPLKNIKVSSVVPGSVTGDAVHELSNMDLAMKFHYLRFVYYFKSDEGYDILGLKKPMFPWLDFYFAAAGRIRRDDSGRPFIKCNDGGVRIIESHCVKTIEEFLNDKDSETTHHRHVVADRVLGPDLFFSPLIFVQYTWFKCGGLSIGISWPHVLGDPMKAIKVINTWGQIMAGNLPGKHLYLPKQDSFKKTTGNEVRDTPKPLWIKAIAPVEDHWQLNNNCKMTALSFKISESQLKQLQSQIKGQDQVQITGFQAISALIWKSLAKIRGNEEPKTVTICRDDDSIKRAEAVLSNEQVINTVTADFSVAESDLLQLCQLISSVDLSKKEMLEGTGNGLEDLIVYGANLTFVDLEETLFYGLELKGQKPCLVDCMADGIGENGVVLIFPGSENGRTVSVTISEDEANLLKAEMKMGLNF